MKKTALLLSLILILTGCSGKQDNTIRLADQYGLAYAPLQIMKARGFLQELHPGVTVEWTRLANTAAIREAVLSGSLDAGFMGIPPFLISRDKGMEWKIAAGLSRAPLGLVVPAGEYTSLAQIPRGAKIALPQPGSIQHILLSMACEEQTGDPQLLDENLIALKHPDGLNALFSGAVQGHFTSPPYLFQEQDDPRFEVLVSGEEAMGEPFTFIAAVVTEEFRRDNEELYRDFLDALDMSIAFLDTNREESLDILSTAYHMDREELEEQLYRSGMVFESSLRGLDRFITFMQASGYIGDGISEQEVCF